MNTHSYKQLRNGARHVRASLWLPLLLVGMLSAGCGSDSTAPEVPAQLSGQVRDSTGNPIADMPIAIVYTLDQVKPDSAMGRSARLSPGMSGAVSTTLLRVEVFDYLGRRVRLLVDNPSGAQIGTAGPWEGDNDNGDPAPNRLYTLRMMIREQAGGPAEIVEQKVMLLVSTPEDLLLHRHTLTGADGRFTIPLALLPVGEQLTYSTPGNPNPVGDLLISTTVHVYALRRVGTTIESAHQDILVENRTTPLQVDLTLP